MNRLLNVAAILAGTTLLAACHSGGDDDPPPPTATTYSVGGAVTGLSTTGLVLQVTGTSNVTVASGATTFASTSALTSGSTYQVTVATQPSTQTCTVGNGSGSIASANVTNVTVSCVTNTHTVGATVTGLTGSGLVLQLNGANNLSVLASGSGVRMFANSLNAGTTYTVTVLTQPTAPNQQCTVANGTGTLTGNVTNVAVTCANLTTLSGSAAVGAPLAGLVSVKDAAGTVRSVQIGVNGAYSIDVAGMTAPFVLRASGTANGHTYIVHSAAVAADVGNTINVTQLTDLIVDNIAGQLAKTYFDNGNFSGLTPNVLDAETTILKLRLLPVLTALGVDAGADLLRTRFTPLASALDSALDLLRVTVNTTNNIATITNLVTLQQIQDSIVTPAASEVNPPVMSDTGGAVSGLSDLDAAKAALTRVASRFAAGLPSSATLMADMTTDFLSHDMDSATFIARFLSNGALVGSSFTDVDIKFINYSDTPRVLVGMDFSIKDRNGVEYQRIHNFRVRKDTDGVWRLHGTQQVIIAEGSVTLYKSLTTGCINGGVEFNIIDVNPANNGATINHINVYGPGLVGGFIRYNPPANSGDFWENTTTGNFTNSCAVGAQRVSEAAIAAIPDDSAYFYIAFTSADNSVRYDFPTGAVVLPGSPANGAYVRTFQRRPMTLAESTASTSFAVITSPVNLAALNAYTSGPLLISATNINPNFYIDLTFGRSTASGSNTDIDQLVEPTSTGTMSTTLSMPAPAPGDAIVDRGVNVRTSDVYRRTIMTDLHSP